MITIEELKEILAERYDPDLLLELLEIDSSELVEAFHDKVEARFDHLVGELEQEGMYFGTETIQD